MRLLAGAPLGLVLGVLSGVALTPLPAPTGPFPIGTTTCHLVDTTRHESFTPGAANREIELHVWYPADAAHHGSPAPYLRDGAIEAQTFARALRRPEHAFDDLGALPTHAEFGRPFAGGRFPVVIFSAGYTGVAAAHTALLEDLASHGYVVINVVHPYEQAAATLADRRVVTMLDEAGAFLKPIAAVFAEWSQEDESMAAVTSASGEPAQRAALHAYLAGLRNTNEMTRRWVDDERFVIEWLRQGRTRTPAQDAIGAHVDLSHIAAAGHSMGGVAGAQFCAEEKDCRGAINFDGIPQYGPLIDRTTPMNKPIVMVYSARPGRAGANDAIYRPQSSIYYRVDVADTRHLDFSDMTLWGGPLREIPVLGSIDPVRVTTIMRTIALEFFDQVLKGRQAGTLNATVPMPLPGVTIRKMRGGAREP